MDSASVPKSRSIETNHLGPGRIVSAARSIRCDAHTGLPSSRVTRSLHTRPKADPSRARPLPFRFPPRDAGTPRKRGPRPRGASSVPLSVTPDEGAHHEHPSRANRSRRHPSPAPSCRAGGRRSASSTRSSHSPCTRTAAWALPRVQLDHAPCRVIASALHELRRYLLAEVAEHHIFEQPFLQLSNPRSQHPGDRTNTGVTNRDSHRRIRDGKSSGLLCVWNRATRSLRSAPWRYPLSGSVFAFSAPPARTRVPPENADHRHQGAGYALSCGCPDSRRRGDPP